MPGNCCICGRMKSADCKISLHRFPKKPEIRKKWLDGLELTESDINSESRVCSMHFRDGNIKNIPSIHIGIKFADAVLSDTARGKRRLARESQKEAGNSKRQHLSCTSPLPSCPNTTYTSTPIPEPLTVSPAESLTNESFSLLLSESSEFSHSACVSGRSSPSTANLQITVDQALVAQIELLKAENHRLKSQLAQARQAPFRIECIADNDSLVLLYTGFPSYDVLLTFFTFLGPAVNQLRYWGCRTRTRTRRRMKLDPLNQLFMTLVKLKLDLSVRDIAFRFQISSTTVSRYFITWVCFLYQELREIEWFPSKDQVAGTLPFSFRERYPTTVSIIDASEVFIQTPPDLMLQSTAWSNYKHHNTMTFLVACTPNGAISFISQMFLGSVSDPVLTQNCGFFNKLDGMSGVSVMADRGFTVKEALAKLGVELNLPPFMEGRTQLPADEMERGRSIASLRIHVERAIGRMKHYKILTGVFPLKMARLANQIVSVCAYLSNFQPALVPPPVVPQPQKPGTKEDITGGDPESESEEDGEELEDILTDTGSEASGFSELYDISDDDFM